MEGNGKLESNESYRKLKEQQATVSSAVSYITSTHYTSLNASVVAIGGVSRKFEDALAEVKRMRADIKTVKGRVEDRMDSSPSQQCVSSDTLRSLYSKKAECNAVIDILEKLERLKESERVYDDFSREGRVWAATNHLSESLSTLFSPSVASIAALSTVSEVLMRLKQDGEDFLVGMVMDVVYLRTGGETGNKRRKGKGRGKRSRRRGNKEDSDGSSDSGSASEYDQSSDDSSSASDSSRSNSHNHGGIATKSFRAGANGGIAGNFHGRVLPGAFLSSPITHATEVR